MFQKVHRYLEKMTPERPAVLREMEVYAADNDFPIVGPLVGRYLYQVAMITKSKKILELGSGFGYSAFWFSLAARGKGRITMTDTDSRFKRMAYDYFKTAGLQSQFVFKVGDAINVLKRADGPFDIIFNDIDKIDYPKTVNLAAKKLKKGGLFITDNLIWSGKVCDKKQDKETRAIVEFTESLYSDSRFFTTVIPIRDGLAVAVRL